MRCQHEMLARAMEGDAKSYAEIERLMTQGGAGQAERSDYQRPSMAQDMEKGRRDETGESHERFHRHRGRSGRHHGTHA